MNACLIAAYLCFGAGVPSTTVVLSAGTPEASIIVTAPPVYQPIIIQSQPPALGWRREWPLEVTLPSIPSPFGR